MSFSLSTIAGKSHGIYLLREVFFLFFFLIYLHFYFQLIDEFTDVNDGEKELMKLWNLHLMKNRLDFVLSVW